MRNLLMAVFAAVPIVADAEGQSFTFEIEERDASAGDFTVTFDGDMTKLGLTEDGRIDSRAVFIEGVDGRLRVFLFDHDARTFSDILVDPGAGPSIRPVGAEMRGGRIMMKGEVGRDRVPVYLDVGPEGTSDAIDTFGRISDLGRIPRQIISDFLLQDPDVHLFEEPLSVVGTGAAAISDIDLTMPEGYSDVTDRFIGTSGVGKSTLLTLGPMTLPDPESGTAEVSALSPGDLLPGDVFRITDRTGGPLSGVTVTLTLGDGVSRITARAEDADEGVAPNEILIEQIDGTTRVFVVDRNGRVFRRGSVPSNRGGVTLTPNGRSGFQGGKLVIYSSIGGSLGLDGEVGVAVDRTGDLARQLGRLGEVIQVVTLVDDDLIEPFDDLDLTGDPVFTWVETVPSTGEPRQVDVMLEDMEYEEGDAFSVYLDTSIPVQQANPPSTGSNAASSMSEAAGSDN